METYGVVLLAIGILLAVLLVLKIRRDMRPEIPDPEPGLSALEKTLKDAEASTSPAEGLHDFVKENRKILSDSDVAESEARRHKAQVRTPSRSSRRSRISSGDDTGLSLFAASADIMSDGGGSSSSSSSSCSSSSYGGGDSGSSSGSCGGGDGGGGGGGE